MASPATLMCTSSPRASSRIISATMPGTGAKLPGHDASLCGQESQVPRCRAHSAGMRNPRAAGVCRSVKVALRETVVGVDAAVPQERPVGAHAIDLRQVAIGREDCFVAAALHQYLAMGIDDERCAPELDAEVFRLAAGKHLVPDAVDRHDVAAIGDRVASLDGLPRRLLALAIL